MEYLKTSDKNIIIEYDLETKVSRVIDLAELEKQAEEAKKRLAEIPPEPTDEELLKWARENYPKMDYSVEKASLEAVVQKLVEIKSVLGVK